MVSSEVFAPELVNFKQQMLDNLNFALSNCTDTQSLLEMTQDEPFYSDFSQHIEQTKQLLQFLLDMIRTIGKPKRVEKYFNIIDGDVVECSREDYRGLLDEDFADEMNPALP